MRPFSFLLDPSTPSPPPVSSFLTWLGPIPTWLPGVPWHSRGTGGHGRMLWGGCFSVYMDSARRPPAAGDALCVPSFWPPRGRRTGDGGREGRPVSSTSGCLPNEARPWPQASGGDAFAGLRFLWERPVPGAEAPDRPPCPLPGPSTCALDRWPQSGGSGWPARLATCSHCRGKDPGDGL